MSAVTDLLDQLIAGKKTIEEVVEDFGTRDWPVVARQQSNSMEEAETRALDDPDLPPEGSFHDVASYFNQGKIDFDTYSALATSAAEGMKKTDAPGPGTPSVANRTADSEEHF